MWSECDGVGSIDDRKSIHYAQTFSDPARCLKHDIAEKNMKIKKWFVALYTGLLALSVQGAPVSVVNADFENNWTDVDRVGVGNGGRVTFNYSVSGPDIGWEFSTYSGIAKDSAYQRAYEGNHFAFLQLDRSVMSQTFTLDQASDVTLNFAFAARLGFKALQVVQIYLDGNPITLFAADSYAWKLMDIDFGTLSAGDHTLSFAGMSSYEKFGDTAAYIDAVKLFASPVASVAEPASGVLMLAGVGLMGVVYRRRQQRNPVM